MLGTLSTLAATCVLPLPLGLLVCGTVVAVTVGAGWYGNAIIGGVVGDFLGATIQVCVLFFRCGWLFVWMGVWIRGVVMRGVVVRGKWIRGWCVWKLMLLCMVPVNT